MFNYKYHTWTTEYINLIQKEISLDIFLYYIKQFSKKNIISCL